MHINVKWGIYAAIVTLLLSFIIGIFFHVGFAVAILRALIFAALFFALGTGAWALINNFMPELLVPETDDAAANIFGSESSDLQGSDSQTYGSRVNITLGDGASQIEAADAALPDQSDFDEVGNITDLVSGAVNPAEAKNRGLDESNENSYTNSGEGTAPLPSDFAEKEPVYAEETGFNMNFDSFTLDGGSGSGLDPFGDSFSLPADSGGTAKNENVSLPERKVSGNKPMALEGDFSPKDIAAGIRTVLDNEKKG